MPQFRRRTAVLVVNAFTGASHATNLDEEGIETMDQFAKLVATAHHISPAHQLLLVDPTGSQFKWQNLRDGQRLFVYDRQLLAQNTAFLEQSRGGDPGVSPVDLKAPRSTLGSGAEADFLVVAQTLLDRSRWAVDSWNHGKQAAAQIRGVLQEITNITTGRHLAMVHLTAHLQNLSKQVAKRDLSAKSLQADLQSCTSWPKRWDEILAIPTLGPSLAKWFDKEEVAQSYTTGKELASSAVAKTGHVEHHMSSLEAQAMQLLRREKPVLTSQHEAQLEPLITDIQALAQKIIEDVNGIGIPEDLDNSVNRARDPHGAVRILKGHEIEIIPEMESVLNELRDLQRKVTLEKRACQDDLANTLHQVSQIQLESAKLKAELNGALSLIDAADAKKVSVARIMDLPFMYGVVLIEINRRMSWITEMASYVRASKDWIEALKAQEARRIEKWWDHYKAFHVADIFAPLENAKLPPIDGDFETIKNPAAPRADDSSEPLLAVSQYLDELRAAGLPEVAAEVRSELDGMSQNLSKSIIDRDTFSAQVTTRYESRIRELESLLLKSRMSHQRESREASTDRSASPVVHSPPPPAPPTASGPHLPLTPRIADSTVAQDTEKTEKLVHQVSDLERTIADLRAQLEAKNKETAQLTERLEKAETNARELQSQVDETAARADRAESTKAAVVAEKDALQHSLDIRTRHADTLAEKSRELSQRLYSNTHNLDRVLANMGLQASKESDGGRVLYSVNRVKGLTRRMSKSVNSEGTGSGLAKLPESGEEPIGTSSVSGVRKPESSPNADDSGHEERDRRDSAAGTLGDGSVLPTPMPNPQLLHWVLEPEQDAQYQQFLDEIYIDYDIYRDAVSRRFADVERVARKYHSEMRSYRDRVRKLEQELRQRLALYHFSVGDLILFLPTRDPERHPNPWAAFNVNAPHYFLDPQIASQIRGRDYLIARATAITQYQVGSSANPVSSPDPNESNPFGLPEGMRWSLISAHPT